MTHLIKFMINIILDETNRIYFILSRGAINEQTEQFFKRDFDVEEIKLFKYVIRILR